MESYLHSMVFNSMVGFLNEVIVINCFVLNQLCTFHTLTSTHVVNRATSRQITLPDGYTCERCTLQLLRQASEWSAGRAQYIFWSCAEISIQEG